MYCDLWQFTTDTPTPPGAIPTQLRQALEHSADGPSGGMLKLYNASNFFDSKAVPPVDDEEIAHLAAPFEQVVVECHPRLLGPRCVEFADRLAPFVPPEEAVLWAERSAALAFDQGAAHVALVPVRGGSGELERLEREGHFTAPTLAQVEEAFERCLASGPPGVVAVDLWDLATWDLERLATCQACGDRRRERLARMNLSGKMEPSVLCNRCEEGWKAAPVLAGIPG